MSKNKSRRLFVAFGLQLPAGKHFNLILPTLGRVLAPSVDRLASLELESLFKGHLRAEVFDCVGGFHVCQSKGFYA